MEGILEAIVVKNWTLDGKPASLCDVGYCDVGLDNGWAKCHGSPYSYHDTKGAPVVNEQRFPSMANMTAKAHSLGLTMSWYANLCGGCQEKNATAAMYKGDVDAIARYGYDGIKIDGCGAEDDMGIKSLHDLYMCILYGRIILCSPFSSEANVHVRLVYICLYMCIC